MQDKEKDATPIQDSIRFGSKTIIYSLEYCTRKTLGISVMPDMTIYVKAPIGSSLEKIRAKICARAPWILKQQYFFMSFHPKSTPKKYVSGETHLYLGRQYKLKVYVNSDEKTQGHVQLKNGKLEVIAKDPSVVKNLIENWYLTKAHEKIFQIAKPLFERFKSRHHLTNVTYHVSIKKMSKRWGSCSANGKILLNPELIKAPPNCIAYVIIHEMCHLIHHEHTQKFFQLQEKEMPDWERWKMKLEQLLA